MISDLTHELNECIRSGDTKGVRELTDKNPDVPQACVDVDADGWSPFTLACDEGDLDALVGQCERNQNEKLSGVSRKGFEE